VFGGMGVEVHDNGLRKVNFYSARFSFVGLFRTEVYRSKLRTFGKLRPQIPTNVPLLLLTFKEKFCICVFQVAEVLQNSGACV